MSVKRTTGACTVIMLLIAAGVIALAGCGGGQEGSAGGEGQAAVGIRLGGEGSEFTIEVEQTSAPAGQVTFAVTNTGAIEHELVLVKTDTAPDAFALEGDKAVEPSGGEGEVVDEVEEIEPGKTATLTAALEPGKYVFICNLPGHYSGGMHAGFTAE